MSSEKQRGPQRQQTPLNQLIRSSIRFSFGAQVYPQLLALLVEMAAFQAQRACDVGHVVMMAAQFCEQYFAFEGFDAVGQRAVSPGGRGLPAAEPPQPPHCFL